MTRSSLRRLQICVLALAGLCASCGDGHDAEQSVEYASATIAQQLTPAEWVQRLRSAHRAADRDLGAGDEQRALLELRAALELPAPAGVLADHQRVARQDLCFRVARIELRAGRFDFALASTDIGLGLGRARDVFTANLLIARGEAFEAQKRDTEAAASYYEALQINAELLRAALGSSDAGAP